MEYIYYFQSSLGIIDKTEPECKDCISKANHSISKINCPINKENRLQKRSIGPSNSLLIFCTSKDIKSKNKFRERLEIHHEVLEQTIKKSAEEIKAERDDFKRHLHNLVSLNAKSLYSVYALFPQEIFMDKSREELLSEIKNVLSENPDDSAKLVLDLLKNENLKKSELSVYNKIFKKEDPDIFPCSIHKIALLVLNIFWGDLKEKGINITLGNCYEYIDTDFDAAVAIFIHIFLNTVKYILPSTKLKIEFEKTTDHQLSVSFTMLSLKIKNEELEKLFHKGYSGEIPTQLKKNGEGLGLWVVRELLQSIQGSISIYPNIDSSKKINRLGVKYEKNLVQVTFPLSDGYNNKN